MRTKNDIQDRINSLKMEIKAEEEKLKAINNAEKDNIDLSKFEGNFFKVTNDVYLFGDVFYEIREVIDYITTNGEKLISFNGYKVRRYLTALSYTYEFSYGRHAVNPEKITGISSETWFEAVKETAKTIERRLKEHKEEEKYKITDEVIKEA